MKIIRNTLVIKVKFFTILLIFLLGCFSDMEKTDIIFDVWNADKKKLQKNEKKLEPNVGEIRMYKVGVNLGNEISREEPFMRPCVVLNNFVGGDLVLVAPLTSKKHNGRFEIELHEYASYGLAQASYVLINQIKSVSKKRLVYKINARKSGTERVKLVGKSVLEQIKLAYVTKILKI